VQVDNREIPEIVSRALQSGGFIHVGLIGCEAWRAERNGARNEVKHVITLIDVIECEGLICERALSAANACSVDLAGEGHDPHIFILSNIFGAAAIAAVSQMRWRRLGGVFWP
jgi:hypothetical protein